MQVRFTELAKLEFDEARAWYRAIRPELGRSFSQEVRTATQRITHMPLIYRWKWVTFGAVCSTSFPTHFAMPCVVTWLSS
jgi:plasmid stabilization system protein ParE